MGNRTVSQGGIDRRSFLLASAAFAGAALSAGPLAAQEKPQLVMWTPGGSEGFCRIHDELLQAFASVSDDVAGAELTCGLGADAEFTQALLAAIASGNPPDFTLLWDTPVALGAQGAFLPLDEQMAKSKNLGVENWPEGLLRTCQFKGQTFGLPVAAGVYGIWFNEELFESKGMNTNRDSLPKTWDEMRKLSKEFTRWEGDRLEVAGFMPPREPETIPIWAALNGSQIFDDKALKYTIDSEANVAMFEYFLSWLDEEYKGDILAVDRSGHFRTMYNSDDGVPPAFQLGRLAGVEAGSWCQGDFYSTVEPVFTRWNVAQHPVGPGGKAVVSGTWPNWFVIPKSSKNPDAAVAYLDVLAVDGVNKWYQKFPDLPVNRKVKPTVPEIVVEKRGDAFAKEITAFFSKQAEIVTPMWNSPVQSFGQDQLKLAMEKIYTKTEPVKAALAAAQTASQAELEKVLKG